MERYREMGCNELLVEIGRKYDGFIAAWKLHSKVRWQVMTLKNILLVGSVCFQYQAVRATLNKHLPKRVFIESVAFLLWWFSARVRSGVNRLQPAYPLPTY